METTCFNREVDIPTNFTGIAKFPNGDLTWYQDGLIHREDGPAIIWANGIKFWYQNGKLHRLDGPAVEYPDPYEGGEEYWIKGTRLTKKEFDLFQWMWENTYKEQNQELMEALVVLVKVK